VQPILIDRGQFVPHGRKVPEAELTCRVDPMSPIVRGQKYSRTRGCLKSPDCPQGQYCLTALLTDCFFVSPVILLK
jgi:hypothetical protein